MRSRCELCQKCNFDEQRSATRLPRHIYKHFAGSDIALRNRIYTSNAIIRGEGNTEANLATLSVENASVLTAVCQSGTSEQQFKFPLSTSGSMGSSRDPGAGFMKSRVSEADINDCSRGDVSGSNRLLLEAFVDMVWSFIRSTRLRAWKESLFRLPSNHYLRLWT